VPRNVQIFLAAHDTHRIKLMSSVRFYLNGCCVCCRLYLVNSPVVRADNLRFKEEGVRDVVKDVFLPWYNAYRFLMQNVERLQRVSFPHCCEWKLRN